MGSRYLDRNILEQIEYWIEVWRKQKRHLKGSNPRIWSLLTQNAYVYLYNYMICVYIQITPMHILFNVSGGALEGGHPTYAMMAWMKLKELMEPGDKSTFLNRLTK